MAHEIEIGTRSRERRRQDLAQVHDLVASCSEAILTARDSQGILRTSLVQVRPGDSDRVLVAGDPALIAQMKHSREVLLTYADRQSGRWLVLNGIAQSTEPPVDAWRAELPAWLTSRRGSAQSEVAVQILAADLWD